MALSAPAARIWCGYGVLAHNLTKITPLAAEA